MRKVDGAIFSGSYLGVLEKSAIVKEDDVDKRSTDRANEIKLIAAELENDIKRAKVPDLRIQSPRDLPPLPETNALDLTVASLAKFAKIEERLSRAESDWAGASYLAAFDGMGKLSPVMTSLESSTSPDALPLLARWNTLRANAVSDGLLLLPIANSQRALKFLTPKNLVEGKALRHLANLALLESRGGSDEIYALLILLDEYVPKASLENFAVLKSRTGFLGVKIALERSEAFRALRDRVVAIAPELRAPLVEEIARDFCRRREVVWEELPGRVQTLLNQLIEESA